MEVTLEYLIKKRWQERGFKTESVNNQIRRDAAAIYKFVTGIELTPEEIHVRSVVSPGDLVIWSDNPTYAMRLLLPVSVGFDAFGRIYYAFWWGNKFDPVKKTTSEDTKIPKEVQDALMRLWEVYVTVRMSLFYGMIV